MEHEALISEYGAERVERAYDLFNKWQESKSPAKRRRDHAACLRHWVFKRLDEDDEKERAVEMDKIGGQHD